MNLYRDFTPQEEIDREYNVGAVVPDSAQWLERYRHESAMARREIECLLDLRFGPTRDETLDVFPAPQPGAAVLVFIHGGYWRSGSSKDFSLVARGPVARGITVVVRNYSLCPSVTIAEITRQSRALIAWLHREAPRFSADPGRIFAAGHSAGGQQVGMMAATDWPGEYGLPAEIVRAGGIPVSGIFDLQPLRYSYLQPKLQLTHEVILRQSPLLNIPPSGPPLLITLGDGNRRVPAAIDPLPRGLEGERAPRRAADPGGQAPLLRHRWPDRPPEPTLSGARHFHGQPRAGTCLKARIVKPAQKTDFLPGQRRLGDVGSK